MSAQKAPLLSFHRNRGGFLLGATWSHHRSFESRRTHFYLGWFVLTLETKPKRHSDGEVGA